VLRSVAGFIIFTNHFLNVGRAIILCCNANRLNKEALIYNAFRKVASVPESIDLGAVKFPINPIA
jgi:hypothetical protein